MCMQGGPEIPLGRMCELCPYVSVAALAGVLQKKGFSCSTRFQKEGLALCTFVAPIWCHRDNSSSPANPSCTQAPV